jgi:hypothetical protein
LPEFRWINTVLSNLKTSFNGTFYALRFDKYSDRYLGAFSYRFNRRFYLAAMTDAYCMLLASAQPSRSTCSGARSLLTNQIRGCPGHLAGGSPESLACLTATPSE